MNKRNTVTLLGLIGLICAGCGGGSSSNRPPQLSSLNNVQISANEASAAISINVTDRGPAEVSVTSDSLLVIADTGIALSGSGNNFDLVLTPVAGALGSATLTVTATDQDGLTDTTSFEVTVIQQQVSFGMFLRDTFNGIATAAPRDVNSRTFDADAQSDDFADLLN